MALSFSQDAYQDKLRLKEALRKKKAIYTRLRSIRKTLTSLDATFLDDAIVEQQNIKLTTLYLEDESENPEIMFYKLGPASEVSTFAWNEIDSWPITRSDRAEARRIDYALNQITNDCGDLPGPWVDDE